MESASFLQEAVDIIGSENHLPRACSDQVVKEKVTVMDFELQSITLLGKEPGELLLPPGILVVIANSRFPQEGRTTENRNVAVCDCQEARGKIWGTQVKHPQLGLSHSQTAHNQQEER